MKEIAQGCASTAVTMGVNSMVAETICRFGNEDQKKRYVPEITSGRFVAASFALSEPQSGSDAASLLTNARRDGTDYVLNGSAQGITSGDRAGVPLVWARADRAANEPVWGLSVPAAVSPARRISGSRVEGGAKGLHFDIAIDKTFQQA